MGEPCWVGAARTISSIGILGNLPGTTGFLSPPLVCSRNPSKDLNLHKNGYIQALVYGKKPGLPGIHVVDSVYYYSVYRYYKIIMTHSIYFLVHSLGIHTHSLSYSGRGAQTSPAEHLPCEDRQSPTGRLPYPLVLVFAGDPAGSKQIITGGKTVSSRNPFPRGERIAGAGWQD